MEAPREFWGVEVKAGQSIKVDPKKTSSDGYIHISQVALGEANIDKPSDPVVFYLKTGDKKLVLGTLSNDNIPHFLLDLVLHEESEFSHNSENASVHVCGYKIIWDNANGDDSNNPEKADNENDIALEDQDIAKVKEANLKGKGTKYGKTIYEIGESSKQLKIGELSKQLKIVDLEKDEDEFGDVSSDEDDSDSFNPMDISEEESESFEMSDWDEEDEYTPTKKDGQRKERPNKSASKTSVSTKKAKKVTPKKAAEKAPKKAAKTKWIEIEGGRDPMVRITVTSVTGEITDWRGSGSAVARNVQKFLTL